MIGNLVIIGLSIAIGATTAQAVTWAINKHKRSRLTKQQMQNAAYWLTRTLNMMLVSNTLHHGTVSHRPGMQISFPQSWGRIQFIYVGGDKFAFLTASLPENLQRLCQTVLVRHLNQPQPCQIDYDEDCVLDDFKPDEAQLANNTPPFAGPQTY